MSLRCISIFVCINTSSLFIVQLVFRHVSIHLLDNCVPCLVIMRKATLSICVRFFVCGHGFRFDWVNVQGWDGWVDWVMGEVHV